MPLGTYNHGRGMLNFGMSETLVARGYRGDLKKKKKKIIEKVSVCLWYSSPCIA